MKIFVGSDHAGFGLKEKLKPFLESLGHTVEDKGAFEYDEMDDFPDYIIPVAREVSMHPNEVRGIVFGGSGQGEAMAANKFKDVRAVVFYGDAEYVVKEETESIIKTSRMHNNANILAIGGRFVTEETMMQAVKDWLETDFSKDPKYQRRLDKVERING
jgi:ribose 5-phosphate isomerase B